VGKALGCGGEPTRSGAAGEPRHLMEEALDSGGNRSTERQGGLLSDKG